MPAINTRQRAAWPDRPDRLQRPADDRREQPQMIALGERRIQIDRRVIQKTLRALSGWNAKVLSGCRATAGSFQGDLNRSTLAPTGR